MRFIMRAMQIISYLAAGLLFLAGALILIFQGDVDLSLGPDDNSFTIQVQADELQGDASVWIYLFVAIILVIAIYAFYRLGRLMGLFLKQQYFTKQAVGHMRFIAIVYLLFSISNFVSSRWELYKTGSFEWNITEDDIFGLMLSLTFLIVAHILNEARKNMDELENYF